MKEVFKQKFMALVILAATLGAMVPVSASHTQAGLELRKTKYLMDGSGQVWLSVQLVNDGSKPLSIIGLAPAKAGPWTTVSQIATPGKIVRGAIKVKDGGLTALWVDSNAGILRFELPHTK